MFVRLVYFYILCSPSLFYNSRPYVLCMVCLPWYILCFVRNASAYFYNFLVRRCLLSITFWPPCLFYVFFSLVYFISLSALYNLYVLSALSIVGYILCPPCRLFYIVLSALSILCVFSALSILYRPTLSALSILHCFVCLVYFISFARFVYL